MAQYFLSKTKALDLGPPIGKGGEGVVYPINRDPRHVVKIYDSPTAERGAKLQVMIAKPPSSQAGATSIAWPNELAYDGSARVVGFRMPYIDTKSSLPLLRLYHPKTRLQVAPYFTWKYLLHSAANLAAMLATVHANGYVVGDLNESNLLVSSTAMIVLIDCDSMQVSGPNGKIYHCPVGKAEYLPPELHGADLDKAVRNPSQDNFGLAILAFMLLMEGTHPFQGIWKGGGADPTPEENIYAGRNAYVGSSKLDPALFSPPFTVLPPYLRDMFIRCFRDGLKNPAARPTAQEWNQALTRAERELRICSVNKQHQYVKHLTACPWCARRQQLKLDSFPALGTQQPLPPARRPTTAPTNAGAGRARPATATKQRRA